jgi:hypothetical protein
MGRDLSGQSCQLHRLEYLLLRDYERDDIEVFRRFGKLGATCFDVGPMSGTMRISSGCRDETSVHFGLIRGLGVNLKGKFPPAAFGS